jgi:hypothetical protein
VQKFRFAVSSLVMQLGMKFKVACSTRRIGPNFALDGRSVSRTRPIDVKAPGVWCIYMEVKQ